MIKIGEVQRLKVQRQVDFGVYLWDEEDKANTVLLPIKRVPEGIKPGDSLDVFIYRDSEDRLIATTGAPRLVVGSVATLSVKEVTKIGAFLDWGLEKDLLLPYKQQTYKVRTGDLVPVTLYVDKSDRLCASMKIYRFLSCDSGYKTDDYVDGFIYEISDRFGAFVAVDDKYSALIPANTLHSKVKAGDRINARVVSVLEDGRLNLSLKEKAYLQMDTDADIIYNRLQDSPNGYLPFHDKSSPSEIKEEFQMSKNEFKRAIGRLFKLRKIVIEKDGIYLAQDKK